MFQTPPSHSGRPPVMLVKTWLSLAKQDDGENIYSRKRAIDLLQLLFGSIEFAERYIQLNEKKKGRGKKNKVISSN